MPVYTWDDGPGTNGEIFLSTIYTDEDAIARKEPWAFEIYTTRQVGQQLVEFIETQLDVMRTLKIHHLSALPKELNQLYEGLQAVLAEATTADIKDAFEDHDYLDDDEPPF